MASATTIDAALATIRTMEGGCRSTSPSDPCYTRPTSGGSNACGAYQYIGSTWRSKFASALAAGALPAGTPATYSACQSPSWVQDAVARWDVTTFLNSGQPIDKLPLLWYYPVSLNWSQSQLDNTTPPGNSISLGDYQRQWVATFNRISGGNVPITPTITNPQQLAQAAVGAGTQGSTGPSPQQAQLTNFLADLASGVPFLGPTLAKIANVASVPEQFFELFVGVLSNWRYILEVFLGFWLFVAGAAIILIDTKAVRTAGTAVAAGAAA